MSLDGEYTPLTPTELYTDSAADLLDVTNGEVETYPNSVIQSLLQTNATLLGNNQEQTLQLLYNAGYIETASGEQLDMKAREQGISRNEPTSATGVATFFRDGDALTTFTIQNQTFITTENSEVSYRTTEVGKLYPYGLFNSTSIPTKWVGDSANFSTDNSSPYEGSHALSVGASSANILYNEVDTIDQGSRCTAHCRLSTDSGVGILFGYQDEQNYYEARLREDAAVLSLVEVDGGSETQLDSTGYTFPTGEYITVEIDTTVTEDVTVSLIVDGDNVAAVSGTNISFDEDYIGVAARSDAATTLVDGITKTATTLSIEAQGTGERTNVGSNTLTVFENQPTGISSVSNPLPTGDTSYTDTNGQQFVVGTDRETDDELRERALTSSARGGAATVDAIKSALRDIDNIIDVSAIENDDNSTDGDGRPPLSVEFIIYGGTEAEIAETLHKNVAFTERLVGGYAGSVVSYTITDDLLEDDETYTWSDPPITNIDITVDIVVDDTYVGDEEAKSILVEYIGGTDIDGSVVTGTTIGEDIRHDAIRDRIVGEDTGILGISTISIDADGDGNDDSTTTGNGLTVYDTPNSNVIETNAVDGSITINTTQQ